MQARPLLFSKNPLPSLLTSLALPEGTEDYRKKYIRTYMQQLASMSVSTEERLYHVLAVDDSIIDRKLIEGLLKTSSYKVTTVDSGSKALEFLGIQQDGHTSQPSVFVPPQHHQHEVEVNLIITDFSMPGMTGYDLLKRVKESSAFKDIPVVIMSSENVPSRMSRCLEEGAEEFFLKPIQLSDLKRLKPHILKGKLKEQQQPLQASNSTSTITTATISSNTNSSSNSNSSSNKRKALDEALSPERTWPILTSSLAVV